MEIWASRGGVGRGRGSVFPCPLTYVVQRITVGCPHYVQKINTTDQQLYRPTQK